MGIRSVVSLLCSLLFSKIFHCNIMSVPETRDGTAEPVSRDQTLRRERGLGNIHFPPCSADHDQDWQPYPVDPYSCYIISDNYTNMHIYIPNTYTVLFSHSFYEEKIIGTLTAISQDYGLVEFL